MKRNHRRIRLTQSTETINERLIFKIGVSCSEEPQRKRPNLNFSEI